MSTQATTPADFSNARVAAIADATGGLLARNFDHMVRAREAEARRRVSQYLPDHLLSEFERAGTTRETLGL